MWIFFVGNNFLDFLDLRNNNNNNNSNDDDGEEVIVKESKSQNIRRIVKQYQHVQKEG